MRKFFVRGIIYAFPLIVICMSVWLIDPYYLFWENREFCQLKYNIGYSYDQGRRYKLFTYKNAPTNKIVLGASEINNLNEHVIPDKEWHSLSFGGAPLQESINLYWEIVKNYPIKEVILAPEFIKYYLAISKTEEQYYSSFDWRTSQSEAALEIYDNKLDYFIDKYTLEATWSFVKACFNIENKRGIPNNKEWFWKHQIDYAKKTFACDVENDLVTSMKESFKAIKEYSDKKGIVIKIVIPIQHIDLIALEYAEPTRQTYYDYLSTLVEIFGTVYYFDYPSNISVNKEKFSDPFHYLESDIYIQSFWGKEKYYYELNHGNFKEILLKMKSKI